MTHHPVNENDHCCKAEEEVKELTASLTTMNWSSEDFKSTALKFIATMGECPRLSTDLHYIALARAFVALTDLRTPSTPLAA
jgi:hypothetical protein